MGFKNRDQRTFAHIIADGSIRVTAGKNEFDEKGKPIRPDKLSETGKPAEYREYELTDKKTKVVTKKSKWEFVYDSLEGIIKDVSIYDGKFGSQLNLTINIGGEEDIVFSMNTKSSFGKSMMEKLPNVNFDQEVDLAPYSFIDDEGKDKKGVTVVQDGAKLLNYFYDGKAPAGEKVLHGYPEHGHNEKTSDEWQVHFIGVDIFLKKYITKEICSKFATDENGDAVKTYESPEAYAKAMKEKGENTETETPPATEEASPAAETTEPEVTAAPEAAPADNTPADPPY